MSVERIVQADFSAGAHPGLEDVPRNGCEDIVNGFLRDDGAVERRGGSVNKNPEPIVGPGDEVVAIADVELALGQRTVVYRRGGHFVMSEDDDATGLVAQPVVATFTHHRPIEVAGMVFMPASSADQRDLAFVYGGSRPANILPTTSGTVTLTLDSATATFSTALPGIVAAGMVVYIAAGSGEDRPAVIRSVDTSTQVTLTEPWPYETATGVAFTIQTGPALTLPRVSASGPLVFAASAAGKLFLLQGDKLWQTERTDAHSLVYPAPFVMGEDSFHILPGGVTGRGVIAVGDGLFVFTSGGMYRLGNIAFDLTDEAGNPQQPVEQVSDQVVLWGQKGLVTSQGFVVAPALDDVYLIDAGGSFVSLTGGGRELYRSYVAAGYVPGQATVFRGHYVLPILNPDLTPVELLAWRIDRRDRSGAAPMVRWQGVTGLTTPSATEVRSGNEDLLPALLGGTNDLLDLSGYLNPTAAVKDDADGSDHQLKVTLRSSMASETVPQLWRKLKARFELDDAASDNPTVTAEYATGRPGSSFTALSGSGAEGETIKSWAVNKKAQQIRFRLSTNGAAARGILRAVEVSVRRDGRS